MLLFSDTALLVLFALVLDALVGDPPWLWRHVPHPVVLFGKIIEIADQDFNTPDAPESRRKLYGAIFLIALVACALLTGALLEVIFRGLPFGEIGIVVVGAIFIAQRSLYDHVAAVRDGLSQGGLAGGRKAVAMIVGRDPNSSTRRVSHVPRSNPARKTMPTASSPRRSGSCCSACPDCSPTRQ
jgi:adenosylcobinamide-phosphate synthase